MALAALLSALHLIALAIGAPAVVMRGRALKGPMDEAKVGRVLLADNFWGFAAVLWVTTGLIRAFGGFEKGSDYYLHNRLFHAKLGLLVLILLLEVLPAITFVRWRIALAKDQTPDTSKVRLLFTLNHIQLAILGVMVFVAAFMARGFGLKG